MKKSIFKRIGLIALAVCVAIGSFFVPLTKKQYNSASAVSDVTVPGDTTFYSSNICFASTGNSSDTAIHTYPDFNFSYYLSDNNPPNQVYNFDTVAINYSFSFSLVYRSSSDFDLNYHVKGVSNAGTAGIVGDTLDVESFHHLGTLHPFYNNITEVFRLVHLKVPHSQNGFTINYSTFYIACILGNSEYPSLDMVSVEIFNGFNNPYSDDLSFSSRILNSNIVCYTDTTGAKFFIAIPNWNPDVDLSSVYYDYRIYYLKSSLDYSDNQIYEQGYRNGLADNQQNIYNKGYNAGYDVGFGQGRQDGIIESNDYSFISLIGAVVDVPVQTIRGLLNFTFLGINLFDFLMGLIAILVILFIVKLVRGG